EGLANPFSSSTSARRTAHPARCTSSTASARKLGLRPRARHETLKHVGAEQTTKAWKRHYNIRAGVEGTIHQAVAAARIRHSRYRDLPNTPRAPPALWTRMSTSPSCSLAVVASTSPPARVRTSAATNPAFRSASARRRPRRGHYLGPGVQQLTHDHRPDAAGTTRDQCPFSHESPVRLRSESCHYSFRL